MRVQTFNNNLHFGKIPVLKCKVEENNGKLENATLYKMEPNNPEDAKEIKFSKNARCIYYDFMRDAGKHISDRSYYLLKNDKSKEVIACAQTAKHCRPNNAEFSGNTVFIEEMAENPKYVKGGQPILAHIALSALDSQDNTISTSSYANAIDSLNESEFVQTKTGDWVLPQDSFKTFVKQAMFDTNMKYVNETILDTIC